MEKLSRSYRFLRKIGLNFPEESYGNVSFLEVIKRTFKTLRDNILLKYFMNSAVLSPLNPRKIRPCVLRRIGCKVGKDVFIGAEVLIDSGNSDLITIEDNVHIAARCILLCHKRSLENYFRGDNYGNIKYRTGAIHLKKGCAIGTNTLVMPGVTVGEGAIVGAYSLVTKDVPDWCVAVGRPAKVIRQIPERKSNSENTKK